MHIFRLLKETNDGVATFYSTIEIDGQLQNVLDIWDTLPESKVIPKTADFLKEYVVRRYLLERDVKKINHKYPLYGSLDPFLTLFTTPEEYSKLGYKDCEDLARKCVQARIRYKQSRNPILRRISDE